MFYLILSTVTSVCVGILEDLLLSGMSKKKLFFNVYSKSKILWVYLIIWACFMFLFIFKYFRGYSRLNLLQLLLLCHEIFALK